MEEKDEFEKFLGIEDDHVKATNNKSEPTTPITSITSIASETQETKLEEVAEKPEKEYINSTQFVQENEAIPILMSGEVKIPKDFDTMVKRILLSYECLPSFKYDEVYKELAQLSIKSCPTPTLQVLNLELEKVQAAKDRLSELFIDVLKSHSFKKRAVDILRDSWGRFSAEKSADRRKGEAAYIVSDFERDFASVDALLRASTHVLKNLDSLHDNLSRRVTVVQLQLKLLDFGRSALPDYSFDKTPMGELTEEIMGVKNGKEDDIRDSGMFEKGE
jgi:hypothetical protein